MNSAIVWAVLIVVFLALEAATYQMISTWFAVGSAVAAVLAVMEINITWQIVVFIIVSAICFGTLRPISLKFLKGLDSKTNADSLVGEVMLVTEEIDNIRSTGGGKLRGVEWSIRSVDGETIPAGEKVKVCKIEGVKLIVSRCEGR